MALKSTEVALGNVHIYSVVRTRRRTPTQIASCLRQEAFESCDQCGENTLQTYCTAQQQQQPINYRQCAQYLKPAEQPLRRVTAVLLCQKFGSEGGIRKPHVAAAGRLNLNSSGAFTL